MPDTAALTLKDPSQFRYIGKGRIAITDLRDITVGQAKYGADVRVPGMKYAVIARPPVVGGKLGSFDAAGARAGPAPGRRPAPDRARFEHDAGARH